ncbi:hypothetical protein OAE80_04495 [Planctomycetaceae bacterium]|nr:hypothetical protein [Planctomycetaceae bacterium]
MNLSSSRLRLLQHDHEGGRSPLEMTQSASKGSGGRHASGICLGEGLGIGRPQSQIANKGAVVIRGGAVNRFGV